MNSWVYSPAHRAHISCVNHPDGSDATSLTPEDLQELKEQREPPDRSCALNHAGKAEAIAAKEQKIADFAESLQQWYAERAADRERSRVFAQEMLEARRAAVAGTTETSESMTFVSQNAILCVVRMADAHLAGPVLARLLTLTLTTLLTHDAFVYKGFTSRRAAWR